MAAGDVAVVDTNGEFPVLGEHPYFLIQFPGSEDEDGNPEALLGFYKVEPEFLRDVLVQLIQAL